MTYELEIHTAFCATALFEINGVPANSDDFGCSYDADPYNAEEYGCGDRVFESYNEPREGVLEKYRISETEYREICADLEAGLSFGNCGWCA